MTDRPEGWKPLNANEEDTLRRLVAIAQIGDNAFSDSTVFRLLATLDAARDSRPVAYENIGHDGSDTPVNGFGTVDSRPVGEGLRKGRSSWRCVPIADIIAARSALLDAARAAHSPAQPVVGEDARETEETMPASKHGPLVAPLAQAMLDARCGADVSASWGPRIQSEQKRRTEMMASRLIEALSRHGLVLIAATPEDQS